MKRTLILITVAAIVFGTWATARQTQLTAHVYETDASIMQQASCPASSGGSGAQ